MRNKIATACAVLIFTACDTKKKVTKVLKEEKKTTDFVVFSGEIIDKNSDKITIYNSNGFEKEISLFADGSFKDTLRSVETGYYKLFDGRDYATLFLENGADIYMTLNTNQFSETLVYKGEGSEENSFLAELSLKEKQFNSDDKILDLSKPEFDKKHNSFITGFQNKLGQIKDVNPKFDSIQKLFISELKQRLLANYENYQFIKKNLAPGMEAPLFNDFFNFKGGTKSLSDFKGKYVYVDVWATWCGPCKLEIPYYRELINKYKENNKIVFLGVSIENEKSFDLWKNLVAEERLGGFQLFSNRNIDFIKSYRITGIPRFILIDPNGKVVNAQAPRPSDPNLVELFTSLGI